MNGKWDNEFRKVNLIKEIKLRRLLKASFYDRDGKSIINIWELGVLIKHDEYQFNRVLIKLMGQNKFGINLLKLN